MTKMADASKSGSFKLENILNLNNTPVVSEKINNVSCITL